MEKYIYVAKAGTLAVSDAFPISLNKSNAVFSELFASLKKTNQMLHAGEVTITDIDLTTFDDTDSYKDAFKGCTGSNKTKKYWWGRKFYFDSCKVSAIAGGIVGGAALTALLTGPVAAVLAPILAGEFVWFVSLAEIGGYQKGMFFAVTWVGVVHWWGIQ